jgi:hypothetical protein
MNCRDCLDELATRSLRELPSDSPLMEHCATCADCARLATALREREYDAASVLNNLPPLSSPIAVAETAVGMSNRRRVGRVVVMLSGIAGAIIIWIVGATMVVPAMFQAGILGPNPARLHTETIRLACLSPAQAADIIYPYVRSHGSTFYTPTSGLRAITVRGTSEEVAKSRILIGQFEKDAMVGCDLSLAGQLARLKGDVDGALAGEKSADERAADKATTRTTPPTGGVQDGVPTATRK